MKHNFIKIITICLVIGFIIVAGAIGYNYMNKVQSPSTSQAPGVQLYDNGQKPKSTFNAGTTAQTNLTSEDQSLINEVQSTVDDDGAADLQSLQKEASSL